MPLSRESTRTRTATTEQQQSSNQVHPNYASVENEDGVSFSQGNMRVDGSNQVPTRVEHWESSNGTTQYTTVEWNDPSTNLKRVSCNCPGWAMKKKGKPRQCKHTKGLMGIKACNSRQISATAITTAVQAEQEIPKFDGRELRGIMLDFDID